MRFELRVFATPARVDRWLSEKAPDGARMHIFWFITIGLVAGVIARLVTPGKKAPYGFMLTALLGIIGTFGVAYLGQEGGWYRVEKTAGLIGAVFGAALVLCTWALLFRSGRPTSSL